MPDQELGQLGLKVGGYSPKIFENYGMFGKVNTLQENCRTFSFSGENGLNFIAESLNLPPSYSTGTVMPQTRRKETSKYVIKTC